MERYRSLKGYLKETFGHPMMKLSLDIGCTCPNRDGRIGFGGCSFCSEGGSGDFAAGPQVSIADQITSAIERIAHKSQGYGYIAYLQAFTNTYGDRNRLAAYYQEILSDPRIEALSIGTRSDCIDDEILNILGSCAKIKPVWIELGYQTMHDETHQSLNTGSDKTTFDLAVRQLQARNIPVIAHMILGLPNEDKQMVLASAKHLANLGVDGVKLQLLHILKGTALAHQFAAEPFHVLTEDQYVDWVISCLEVLPESTVIHRLTGDGPRELLIAPTWSLHKRHVLNAIAHELKVRDTWQGRRFHGRTNRTL